MRPLTWACFRPSASAWACASTRRCWIRSPSRASSILSKRATSSAQYAGCSACRSKTRTGPYTTRRPRPSALRACLTRPRKRAPQPSRTSTPSSAAIPSGKATISFCSAPARKACRTSITSFPTATFATSTAIPACPGTSSISTARGSFWAARARRASCFRPSSTTGRRRRSNASPAGTTIWRFSPSATTAS